MNMIGDRFHKLIVEEELKGSMLQCRCDCGNVKNIRKGHFKAGYYKSCGCHVDRHNMCKSREHVTWGNMIARCHNPKNKRYKDYGGKGIVVCDRWRESFKDFYGDMGDCPEGYQIDRIDNLGIYEPSNCRWVSPKENMANRRNTKIYVIHGQEFKTAEDAAARYGVTPSTILSWCDGRKVRDYLARTKEFVVRNYPPKEGCMTRHVYCVHCKF